MHDIVGEDWINMLILEGKVTLDIGAMDSGVIFNHKDNVSLSSVNTKGYMTKNTMAGVAHKNGKAMVKGFATTKSLTSTPMDQDGRTTAPSGEVINPQSNSDGEVQEELPPSAATGVV